jgi:hypothetical protein
MPQDPDTSHQRGTSARRTKKPEPRKEGEFREGDLVRTFIGKAPIDAEVQKVQPARDRKLARLAPGFHPCAACAPYIATEHVGKVEMKTLAKGERMVRTTDSVELITAVEERGK